MFLKLSDFLRNFFCQNLNVFLKRIRYSNSLMYNIDEYFTVMVKKNHCLIYLHCNYKEKQLNSLYHKNFFTVIKTVLNLYLN